MPKSGFVTWEAFKAHKDKNWRTVHHIWPNIRGVTVGPAPKGATPPHTHVKVDITDTPWVWTDVSKAGSNLTELTTRQHAGLTDVTHSQHHNKLHSMTGVQHSAAGLTIGHVLRATAADAFAWGFLTKLGTINTGVWQGTPIANAYVAGIDQNLLTTSSPTHVTAKLTDLTDGYIPYHVDDATGLANSPIFIDGAKVGIGTAFPNELLELNHATRILLRWNFNTAARGWIGNPDVLFAGASSDDFGILALNKLQLGSDGATLGLTITGGNVGIGVSDPDEKLEVNGTVKATTFQGNLHWDYITNEPTAYTPEYHVHVGKEIVSLHLVDLDYDPKIHGEDADIFDVLPTAAIHGEGNYDWWGTWDTTAAANTSAEVVVEAGTDKILRLTDNNGGGDVLTELTADAGHVMVTGVVEFRIRQSATNKRGWILFMRDAQQNMGIYMSNDGDMYLIAAGASTAILTYAADTWYKIRLHYDCVARACVLFVDNVFVFKKDLAAIASGDFVNKIEVRTHATDTGYTLDINRLKVFNLTI